MSEAIKKADPGTPFDLRARDWNAVVDSARSTAASKFGHEGTVELIRGFLNASSKVLVSYAGGDLDEFSILTYPANSVLPGIDPSVNPFESQRTPVFAAVAPTSSMDPVLVLTGPYSSSAGALVRAVREGIAVCDVNVTVTTHGFAMPIAGDTDKLTSTPYGPARILYKPAGTGVKRCLVEVIDRYQDGFYARLTSVSAGLWKWVRVQGVSDVGSESPEFNAILQTGTRSGAGLALGTTNAGAGLIVWMWPTPGGYYQFSIQDTAGSTVISSTRYYWPGIVSVADQQWTGDKETQGFFTGLEGVRAYDNTISTSGMSATPYVNLGVIGSGSTAGGCVTLQSAHSFGGLVTVYYTYGAGSTPFSNGQVISSCPIFHVGADESPNNCRYAIEGYYGIGNNPIQGTDDYPTIAAARYYDPVEGKSFYLGVRGGIVVNLDLDAGGPAGTTYDVPFTHGTFGAGTMHFTKGILTSVTFP